MMDPEHQKAMSWTSPGLVEADQDEDSTEDDETGTTETEAPPPIDEATQLLRYGALNRLIKVGLATEPAPESIELHRLVARFVSASITDTARQSVEAAVFRFARKINGEGLPAPLIPLEPHLRHLADQAEACASPAAGNLFNEFGYHLRVVARFQDARAAVERALTIFEMHFGTDAKTYQRKPDFVSRRSSVLLVKTNTPNNQVRN
jgi:hypothetical protein